MFSKLDRTVGTVRYCEEREPARNGQMTAALAPLPLVEPISAHLDELIEKSDLQRHVAPVSGPAAEHRSGSRGKSEGVDLNKAPQEASLLSDIAMTR
jgi:hypothetical protein